MCVISRLKPNEINRFIKERLNSQFTTCQMVKLSNYIIFLDNWMIIA